MIPSINVARASSAPSGAGALRGLRQQPVQPVHSPVRAPDGQVARRDAAAERVLAGHLGALHVGLCGVAPGDDDGTRDPRDHALLPQREGPRVDPALAALRGRQDEQRRVGRAQPGAQLAEEVAVAGGIQQVDLHAVVHERCDRESDRPALADRGRVVVAGGGALGDRSDPGDRAGVREQRVHQRRLPGSGGSDEDHVADARGRGGGDRCRRTSRPAIGSDRHGNHLREDLCSGSHTLPVRDHNPRSAKDRSAAE